VKKQKLLETFALVGRAFCSRVRTNIAETSVIWEVARHSGFMTNFTEAHLNWWNFF